jgi:hypothetical protein
MSTEGIEIKYQVTVRIPQGVLGGAGIPGIQSLMGAIAGNNSAMPTLPPAQQQYLPEPQYAPPSLPPAFQHQPLMLPPAQEPTYEVPEYFSQPVARFSRVKPLGRAIALGTVLGAVILGFVFRSDLRLATAPDAASLSWSEPDPVSGARTLLEPKTENASQKVEAPSADTKTLPVPDAPIPKDKNAAAGTNPPWDDKLLTPALTGQ